MNPIELFFVAYFVVVIVGIVVGVAYVLPTSDSRDEPRKCTHCGHTPCTCSPQQPSISEKVLMRR